MSDHTPADLGSPWAGSIQTRTLEAKGTSPGVVDMVTVYTDRQAATNQDYDEFFTTANLAELGQTELMMRSRQVTEATGELGFDTDVTGHSKLFMAAALPSGVNQTFNYVDDLDATPEVDETEQPGNGPRKFDGTFRGVPGEFECATGTCSASTNGKSELTMLAGDWTFTPNDDPDDITIMGVIPDADYMSFGYWVQATTDRDGKTTHGISTFAGGTAFPVAADNMNSTSYRCSRGFSDIYR